MRVHDHTFDHPVAVHGGGDHWEWVAAAATAPLTFDGIDAFIRYDDAMATRYAYLSSRWTTENDGRPYAGVLVYAIEGTAAGRPPREHPSNDRRFREIAEAYASPADTPRPATTRPAGQLLWARSTRAGAPVPLAIGTGAPVVDVVVRGAGLASPRQDLWLARQAEVERLGQSPVPVEMSVYTYTHRTRERVTAMVEAGRARPAATWTVGTLAQFDAEGSRR